MSEPRLVAELPAVVYEPLVDAALREDLGRGGDLTTDAVVPAAAAARGAVVARRSGRVGGLAPALYAWRRLDPRIAAEVVAPDGADVGAGQQLVRLEGPARALLTGERTALNLLGHLSGIATATRTMVAAVAGSGAAVVCTRKTTPGLRALEKHAVRLGGGRNHRFGLDDGVLVKDNHLALCGGIAAAVERVRGRVGHLVKVEIEVDDLEALEEALRQPIDALLLDNFGLDDLRRAVALVGGRLITEASGGIGPEAAAAVAATGVDLISVGWLTHSAPALDLSLELEPLVT